MILDRCPTIVVATFIVSALLISVSYTLNPSPSLRIHQNLFGTQFLNQRNSFSKFSSSVLFILLFVHPSHITV